VYSETNKQNTKSNMSVSLNWFVLLLHIAASQLLTRWYSSSQRKRFQRYRKLPRTVCHLFPTNI